MRSTVIKRSIVKRSIVLAGHKASVSLEGAFWTRLKEIGTDEKKTLSVLVAGIDSTCACEPLLSDPCFRARLCLREDMRRFHRPNRSCAAVLQRVPDRGQSQQVNGRAGEP